jgi:hypothetical protein
MNLDDIAVCSLSIYTCNRNRGDLTVACQLSAQFFHDTFMTVVWESYRRWPDRGARNIPAECVSTLSLVRYYLIRNEKRGYLDDSTMGQLDRVPRYTLKSYVSTNGFDFFYYLKLPPLALVGKRACKYLSK